MMQELVNIVLNERENNKYQAAEELERVLVTHNIPSTRLTIDANIIPIILKRQPKVLILDYLIGDYSTGLDILKAINTELPADKQPQVIFYTDEPSLHVAVQAMKLGALDYLELDNPQANTLIINYIKKAIIQKPLDFPQYTKAITLNDLIGESITFKECLYNAHQLAVSSSHYIVIEGENGCGKRSIASAIFQEKKQYILSALKQKNHYQQEDNYILPYLKSVDLSLYDKTYEELFNLEDQNNFQFGHNLSLLITNYPEDDYEFLDYVSENIDHFTFLNGSNSFLFICTDSHEIARAWLRLTKASYLKIPNLTERKDDFSLLLNYFYLKAKNDNKIETNLLSNLSNDFLNWLSEQTWLGNIKELHDIVSSVCLTLANNNTKESPINDIESLKALILELKQAWEDNNQDCLEMITPSLAYQALEKSGFNYRLAAARTGYSISTIRHLLKQEKSCFDGTNR